MNEVQIFNALVEVLAEFQAKQELKCPPLTESVRPLKDLERFDSPMSIAATGKIGRKLGIAIPAGKNIFGDDKGLFTIGKTVAILAELVKTGTPQKAGA